MVYSYNLHMDIKHEIPGDMRITLNSEDVEKLRSGYQCVEEVLEDGVALRTVVMRDSDVSEAIAETSGHEVRVFLPATPVTLPAEVPVAKLGPASEYYFGETGRVILSAAVEI